MLHSVLKVHACKDTILFSVSMCLFLQIHFFARMLISFSVFCNAYRDFPGALAVYIFALWVPVYFSFRELKEKENMMNHHQIAIQSQEHKLVCLFSAKLKGSHKWPICTKYIVGCLKMENKGPDREVGMLTACLPFSLLSSK